MAYTTVDLIEVIYNGKTVGAVTADTRTHFFAFEYAPEWLRGNTHLAPLTLANRRGPRVFPNLAVDTYQRLPAMLADALPDRFGHSLIDAYLAREGVSRSSITPLDRLAYLGRHAMGALEFLPPTGPETPAGTTFAINTLVDEARRAVEGRFGSEHDATEGVRHLLQVGTSAGGARPKAVIAWNRATGEIRSGQMPAPAGFEQWLLKFDGVGKDFELGDTGHFGRIEYAYSLMAREAGINMTECRLLTEGGRAHFMTRRFDRPDGAAKRHVQSLCAMAELDFQQRDVHDYAQLLRVIDDLGLGANTREQAFRRAVFNIAASNCDDHTKNHAFTFDETGVWDLAPAFDITHAHNPQGIWTSRHLMGVDGIFYDAGRDHLLKFADRFAVPRPKQIIDDINTAIAAWPDFARSAKLPAKPTRQIHRDLRHI